MPAPIGSNQMTVMTNLAEKQRPSKGLTPAVFTKTVEALVKKGWVLKGATHYSLTLAGKIAFRSEFRESMGSVTVMYLDHERANVDRPAGSTQTANRARVAQMVEVLLTLGQTEVFVKVNGAQRTLAEYYADVEAANVKYDLGLRQVLTAQQRKIRAVAIALRDLLDEYLPDASGDVLEALINTAHTLRTNDTKEA